MTHDHRCTHGVPMFARCSSCEQEAADEAKNAVANQAKPIMASDCYSTTPVMLCPCLHCVAYVQNHDERHYIGKNHNDIQSEAAGQSQPPPPIPAPVADMLQQRLCDELANLSRNVAGLTGVSQALIDVGERMGHGAPKPCPEKHLKDYDSSDLRAELWRRNGEVVPQHHEVKYGPVTESEVMAFAVSHWGKYALSGGAEKHLRACLTEFARSRGLVE